MLRWIGTRVRSTVSFPLSLLIQLEKLTLQLMIVILPPISNLCSENLFLSDHCVGSLYISHPV
jgi:hypothetical protein